MSAARKDSWLDESGCAALTGLSPADYRMLVHLGKAPPPVLTVKGERWHRESVEDFAFWRDPPSSGTPG